MLFLVASLKRLSPNFSQIPVKKVCTKHPGESPFKVLWKTNASGIMIEKKYDSYVLIQKCLILKAADSEDQTLFTSSTDPTSGTFFLNKNVTHCIKGLKLECNLSLQFPCWSKCGNCNLMKLAVDMVKL